MQHRLLIIGAGGFGRELLGWALGVPPGARDWAIGGFLDANPAALETVGYKGFVPPNHEVENAVIAWLGL